jgi:hypothetical protein
LAGGCGLDSTSSGQGPVAGCCECGDEPSGSCATELVTVLSWHFHWFIIRESFISLHLSACLRYCSNAKQNIKIYSVQYWNMSMCWFVNFIWASTDIRNIC